MRVIISGGGTGGHIYPALAIAHELHSQGADILYMGGRDSAESELAVEYGFSFMPVSCSPLHRRSLKVVSDLLTNVQGMREAKKAIRDFGADIAIGTGGFVTAPVLSAAQSLGVPTMIHEQNAYPGLANRQLAKKAQAVCLTFDGAAAYFPHKNRLHHTGLPVRPQIAAAADGSLRKEACAYFNIPTEEENLPTLLITGGSQGAQSINKAAAAAYELLLEQGCRIIHLCGKKNYSQLRQTAPDNSRLILLPYLERMEYAMALADLALARSGASFLAEAALMGIPSLLVPYPYATNDHQTANAREFAEAKAAVLIEDSKLSGKLLAKTAASVLFDPSKAAEMKKGALSLACPRAAAEIAAAAMSILAEQAK